MKSNGGQPLLRECFANSCNQTGIHLDSRVDASGPRIPVPLSVLVAIVIGLWLVFAVGIYLKWPGPDGSATRGQFGDMSAL